MPFPQIDLTKGTTRPLASRPNKVTTVLFARRHDGVPEVDAFIDGLPRLLAADAPDPAALISIRSPEEASEVPAVLGGCLHALIARHKLPIRYFAAGKGETSERTVHPYHLVHHDGGWHLIAFCELRQALRDFALVRMEITGPACELFHREPDFDADTYLEESFGIFHGPGRHPVAVRFNPFRARWVRHQQWHREQQIEEHPDGSLTLRFPVSHFPEVKMELLKFGADCEVLEPETLRREIAEEGARLVALYGGDGAERAT